MGRKVSEQLRRDHTAGRLREGVGPVARCTVERLMRGHGMTGARRGRRPHTTRPDPKAERPRDLVNRQFRADRPNELWALYFTYSAQSVVMRSGSGRRGGCGVFGGGGCG